MRLLVLAFCLALISLNANAEAYVYAFDGPESAYRVTRAGEESNPKIFQSLAPGDSVSALSRRFDLIVRYGDGTDVVVTRANSPVVIEDRGETATRIAHVLQWARSAFEELVAEKNVSSVNLVTRSNSAASGIIVPGQAVAYISPGTTRIVVAATSAPDFSDAAGNPIAVDPATDPNLWLVQLDPAMLFPIRLKGEAGEKEIRIKEAPDCPYPDNRALPLPEACAIWLASADGGAWDVAALTLLVELDSPLATYLRRVLVHVRTSYRRTLTSAPRASS